MNPSAQLRPLLAVSIAQLELPDIDSMSIEKTEKLPPEVLKELPFLPAMRKLLSKSDTVSPEELSGLMVTMPLRDMYYTPVLLGVFGSIRADRQSADVLPCRRRYTSSCTKTTSGRIDHRVGDHPPCSPRRLPDRPSFPNGDCPNIEDGARFACTRAATTGIDLEQRRSGSQLRRRLI